MYSDAFWLSFYLFHCYFSFVDLELVPASRQLKNALPKNDKKPIRKFSL